MPEESVLEKVKAARAALEKARRTRAELVGRKKALMEQLKRDFGHDTVAAAEAEASKLEAELKEKNQKVLALIQELDGKMEALR